MMFNEKNVTVNEVWVNDLAKCLQARFLDGAVVVTPKKVIKNNGVVLQGMEFRKTGEAVAPIIYVDELEKDGLSAMEAADVAMEWYNRSCNPGFKVDNLSSVVWNWDNVKEYIIPALVNRSRNIELLEGVPHTLVGTDYVVIYKIRLPEIEDGLIKVTGSIFDAWGVTMKELFEVALANLEKEGAVLMTMGDVLASFLGEDAFDDEALPLFVLRNKTGVNGATTILLESVQKEIFAKCGGNVCLIPSSVHEWIIAPAQDASGLSLAELISEVNRTELRPDEILGDAPEFLSANGVNPFTPSFFETVLN